MIGSTRKTWEANPKKLTIALNFCFLFLNPFSCWFYSFLKRNRKNLAFLLRCWLKQNLKIIPLRRWTISRLIMSNMLHEVINERSIRLSVYHNFQVKILFFFYAANRFWEVLEITKLLKTCSRNKKLLPDFTIIITCRASYLMFSGGKIEWKNNSSFALSSPTT